MVAGLQALDPVPHLADDAGRFVARGRSAAAPGDRRRRRAHRLRTRRRRPSRPAPLRPSAERARSRERRPARACAPQDGVLFVFTRASLFPSGDVGAFLAAENPPAQGTGARVGGEEKAATETAAGRWLAAPGAPQARVLRIERAVRAAVLEAVNEPPRRRGRRARRPGCGRGVVRLHASGVCHSDWNVVSGATSEPAPGCARPRGRRRRRGGREGVSTVAEGEHVVLSWLPACGSCFYCVQGRPSLCEHAMEGMFEGTLPERSAAPVAERYAALPLLVPLHLRGALHRPEECCVRIRDDAPLDVAALVGCAVMTGVGAAINRARVEPGSTVAVFGAGGVGLSAILGAGLAGAATSSPSTRSRLQARPRARARRHACGRPEERRSRRRAARAHGRSRGRLRVRLGRLSRRRRAGLRATRRGGTGRLHRHPAGRGRRPICRGPSLPRDEKIVTGSFYGSCRPHVDMPLLLDLFMDGRLRSTSSCRGRTSSTTSTTPSPR